MTYRPLKPIEDLNEKEWTTQIVGTKAVPGLARMLGFWPYHTLRSRGSQPGFPDWTLFRERLVFLELKTEAKASKLSEAQRDVARRITRAGCELYVARPSDLDDLTLVLTARAGRWSADATAAFARLRGRLLEAIG